MRPFDKEFAFLQPEEFVHTLNEDFDLKGVVAGFNYTFGKNGLGTEKTLRALGEKLGFSVDIVPPVLYKNETVSSSRIRDCILSGAMDDARSMLAEPYSLTGTVVKNKRIGVTLGFPTANLLPPAQKVLPRMGVYAAAARIENEIYPAVTNVGNNPTVNGKQVTIETHLLDTSKELYGMEMTVLFYSFLRGEIRFESKDALSRQIAEDVFRTKRIINDLL
jgi:riboflavin kinase/FMN adenylyltransferase